jgi:hypothetical protein
MTEQTDYELDLGEPKERRDPARRPRSRTRTRWPRRRPIAIIAALAAGVALGAVGVESAAPGEPYTETRPTVSKQG